MKPRTPKSLLPPVSGPCWAWLPCLAMVALLGAGCLETRCKDDLACPLGQRCDLASGSCYDVDGSVAHPLDARPDGTTADGDVDADADADATPACTASDQCSDPAAPICDPVSHQCRPCAAGAPGDAECAARSLATPVCEGPGGACVECTDSALHCDADPGEPVCDPISHECRACVAGAQGDADCVARSAATPVCEGTSGGCVECTDSALHCDAHPLTPICDDAAFECRGCAEHTECNPPLGGGVCVASSGRCLIQAEVIYVDADVCPGPGTGTLVDPFCSVQDGVDAAAPGRSTLLVLAGTYAPISLVDTGTIWIVGEAGTQVGTGVNQSIVYVSGDVDLTLEGVRVYDAFGTGIGMECVGNVTTQPVVTLRGCTLTNNSGGGVSATSCTMTLDGNSISGNPGGGVTATSCTVTLDGNSISGNPGGGVSFSGSSFTVVNNFIVQNGSGSSSLGGVSIFQPGAPASFMFNTVADNTANGATPSGVRCIDAVAIGSSIVYGNDNSDLSPNCTPSFCHQSTDGDPMFIGGGDYHLASGSPCIDGGDPASTLDHDVDGQTRPLGSGPDIGADEAM